MIFAAGLGTRLRPLTDNKPKALVQVNGKPLLELVIQKLKRSGFDHLVINVHHFAEQIIDFLRSNNDFGLKIDISHEKQQLLETGGGLLNARHLLGSEPFLVHNVDILTDLNLDSLYKFHLRKGGMASLAVKSRNTSRYLMFDKMMKLKGWKNEKTGEKKFTGTERYNLIPLAFSGIHVIDPKIFDLFTLTGKFSIIDEYLSVAKTHKINGYQDDLNFWLDLGNLRNLKQASTWLRGENESL